METKTFKKGEIIFKQGDLSDCMYDILWGQVGIYADYGTPEEKLLTTLETERFFTVYCSLFVNDVGKSKIFQSEKRKH